MRSPATGTGNRSINHRSNPKRSATLVAAAWNRQAFLHALEIQSVQPFLGRIDGLLFDAGKFRTRSGNQPRNDSNVGACVEELDGTVANGKVSTPGVEAVGFARAFGTVVGVWKCGPCDLFAIGAVDGAWPRQDTTISRRPVQREVASWPRPPSGVGPLSGNATKLFADSINRGAPRRLTVENGL